MQAFELALEHGCHGFEFDVRCTLDHQLIIWHDATVKRMRIAGAGYKQLCERVRKGWRKKSRDSAPAIPCLEEVLAAFRDRAFLNIEIKVSGIEKEVAAAMAAAPLSRGYLVSSFQPDVVLNLRAANPELKLGWIVRDRRLLASWRQIEANALVPHHSLVSRGLVDAVHDAGRMLCVWTVNRPKLMQEMAEWGVDAIISDDTRLLANTLG